MIDLILSRLQLLLSPHPHPVPLHRTSQKLPNFHLEEHNWLSPAAQMSIDAQPS